MGDEQTAYSSFVGKLAGTAGAAPERARVPVPSKDAMVRDESEDTDMDDDKRGPMAAALQRLMRPKDRPGGSRSNSIDHGAQPSDSPLAKPFSKHSRAPSDMSVYKLPPTPAVFKTTASSPGEKSLSKIGSSMRSIMSKVGFAPRDKTDTSAPSAEDEAPDMLAPSPIDLNQTALLPTPVSPPLPPPQQQHDAVSPSRPSRSLNRPGAVITGRSMYAPPTADDYSPMLLRTTIHDEPAARPLVGNTSLPPVPLISVTRSVTEPAPPPPVVSPLEPMVAPVTRAPAHPPEESSGVSSESRLPPEPQPAQTDRTEIIDRWRTESGKFDAKLAKTNKGAKLLDEDVKRKSEQALSAALRNEKRLKDMQEKNEENERRTEALRQRVESLRKDLLRKCVDVQDLVALLEKKVDDVASSLERKTTENRTELRGLESELHKDLQSAIDTSIRAKQKNVRRAFNDIEARIEQLAVMRGRGGALQSAGLFDNLLHSTTELALLGLGTLVAGVTGAIMPLVKAGQALGRWWRRRR